MVKALHPHRLFQWAMGSPNTGLCICPCSKTIAASSSQRQKRNDHNISRHGKLLSQSAETAISWSSDPVNALWFANRSGCGKALAVGEIPPQEVVAYRAGFWNENEIIVQPYTVRNIRYENMIPVTKENVLKLTVPALPDYMRYGKQAERLGYKPEGSFSYHGSKHILRVLLLSLIYYYNSKDTLSEADKGILVYFSLLHDIGRTNDDKDDRHGALSVEYIKKRNLRVGSLSLTKKEYQISHLIIQYHCLDDDMGIQVIQALNNCTKKEKEHVVRLYQICKDMDALDRVRFNGLNYQKLRTSYSRQLPLIVGELLKEDIMSIL